MLPHPYQFPTKVVIPSFSNRVTGLIDHHRSINAVRCSPEERTRERGVATGAGKQPCLGSGYTSAPVEAFAACAPPPVSAWKVPMTANSSWLVPRSALAVAVSTAAVILVPVPKFI